MLSSLAATALLMGLVGGPHCIAMCGAACGAIGGAGAPRSTWGMGLFQVGRLLGYSALGALAAGSFELVGWLSAQSSALRPIWTSFHVLALLLGLMLIWQARQPAWLEALGRRLWAQVRQAAGHLGLVGPVVMGVCWALLPCGLLYSALMVAALAAQPLEGAWVMACFVAGTSVALMGGPWLWLRVGRGAWGDWGMRLAGLGLAGSAVTGLWLGYFHNQAPWCVPAV